MSYDSYDELGENVTHLATAGRKKETSVVSVRMTGSEIAKLERIGRDSGKTVSQVIRDAIAAYRVQHPMMVVDANGVTISTGQPQTVSRNARCQVTLSCVPGNFTGTRVPVQRTS